MEYHHFSPFGPPVSMVYCHCVAFAPKDDGTVRPFSVLPVVWRVLRKAVMSNLSFWSAAVLHPCLIGGIHLRHHLMVSYRFLADLRLAARTCSRIAGLKLDLSKCYDRYSWSSIFFLLQLISLPSELASTYASFHCRRLVCSGNTAARAPSGLP